MLQDISKNIKWPGKLSSKFVRDEGFRFYNSTGINLVWTHNRFVSTVWLWHCESWWRIDVRMRRKLSITDGLCECWGALALQWQHVLSHNIIFPVWVWEWISIFSYVHNIVFFCLCAAMETGCPPSPRGSVHGSTVPEGLGYNAVMWSASDTLPLSSTIKRKMKHTHYTQTMNILSELKSCWHLLREPIPSYF